MRPVSSTLTQFFAPFENAISETNIQTIGSALAEKIDDLIETPATNLASHVESFDLDTTFAQTNIQTLGSILAEKVDALISSHKNTLFFCMAAFYSSLGFPHLFISGIPIGVALSIGLHHFSPEENPWYPLKDASSESTAVLMTAGSLSLAGRIITLFDINFFNYTDGVFPSILSGTMTGMAITSWSLSAIDAIRAKFL